MKLLSHDPKSFLVIEDNNLDFEIINRTLQQFFIPTVNRAKRLSEAKKLLNQTSFDLIILDLQLPDSTGLNTFHTMVRLANNTPIFILTAFGNDSMAVEAITQGAVNFWDKEHINESLLLGRSILFSLERHKQLSSIQRLLDNLNEAQFRIAQQLKRNNLFLANVSHELRTPLNGIMGAVSLLADTKLNREQSDYMTTISHSTQFLSTLVNDLLDVSKIEFGKLALENVFFSLNQLLHECVLQFSTDNKKEGVSFTTQISPEIPDQIKSDPWRLRQIVTNLISNAFKFTEKGNITLAVQLAPSDPTSPSTPKIRISVKDTGCGISKEFVSQLFTPFAQETFVLSHNRNGSGLGLALSKRLAELLKGTLNVESTPGHGSTFTLTFPFEVAPDNLLISDNTEAPCLNTTVNQSTSSENSTQRKLYFRHPPLVLVAEDHPVNQRLVISMLEKLGCRILSADNGKEAIERAAHTSVDLCLIDCQMPEQDGFKTTQELRTLPHYINTPIIAMTAMVYPADIQHCLESGMSDVLKKPFSKSNLEHILNKHLDHLITSEPNINNPVLNSEMVLNWKTVLGENNLEAQRDFLNLFYDTSEEIIDQTKTAVAQGDVKSLKRLVHRFKGSAGHIGADRLGRFLEDVENKLQCNEPVPENLAQRLTEECTALKEAFK